MAIPSFLKGGVASLLFKQGGYPPLLRRGWHILDHQECMEAICLLLVVDVFQCMDCSRTSGGFRSVTCFHSSFSSLDCESLLKFPPCLVKERGGHPSLLLREMATPSFLKGRSAIPSPSKGRVLLLFGAQESSGSPGEPRRAQESPGELRRAQYSPNNTYYVLCITTYYIQ